MPTDNVSVLPGVHRADLDIDVPVERVLKSALDCGLRDVAVVGRRIDGELAVFGSAADGDTTIGLLVRGMNWLAEAHQVAHKEDD